MEYIIEAADRAVLRETARHQLELAGAEENLDSGICTMH